MLGGHPAVHQGTGAARAAQVLHPFLVGLSLLPSRQLDQRLVLPCIGSFEAIHPGHPPALVASPLFPAYVARITFAMSHNLFCSPAAQNITFRPAAPGKDKLTRNC